MPREVDQRVEGVSVAGGCPEGGKPRRDATRLPPRFASAMSHRQSPSKPFVCPRMPRTSSEHLQKMTGTGSRGTKLVIPGKHSVLANASLETLLTRLRPRPEWSESAEMNGGPVTLPSSLSSRESDAWSQDQGDTAYCDCMQHQPPRCDQCPPICEKATHFLIPGTEPCVFRTRMTKE